MKDQIPVNLREFEQRTFGIEEQLGLLSNLLVVS